MFKFKNETKKEKIIILSLLMFFVTIGIISVLVIGNKTMLGSLENPDNDDVKYIRSAYILFKTGMYTYHDINIKSMFMMPGTSILLSMFMHIFSYENSIIAYRIFQIIVETFSIYIVYLISREIFSKRVGIIFIVLSMLYIPSYYVPGLILQETVFKFLISLLLYVSIIALRDTKKRFYIFGGVVLGLACLFRPNIALYPVIILLIWISKKYKFKEIVKFTLCAVIPCMLILSPWWIRNYKIKGEIVIFTEAVGDPFWLGTYVNYEKSQIDILSMTSKLNGNEYHDNKIKEDIAKENVKKLFKETPIKGIAWYTVGKAAWFFATPFLWVKGKIFNITLFYHLFLIISCIIGIILAYKRDNKKSSILSLFLLYMVSVYLPFFTFDRYSYPVIIIVTVFSAYFINEVLFRKKDKRILEDKE